MNRAQIIMAALVPIITAAMAWLLAAFVAWDFDLSTMTARDRGLIAFSWLVFVVATSMVGLAILDDRSR